MKDRKIILGDLYAVQSDLGLDFYLRSTDEKVTWINQASVEKLLEILPMNDIQYDAHITRIDRKKKLDKLYGDE